MIDNLDPQNPGAAAKAAADEPAADPAAKAAADEPAADPAGKSPKDNGAADAGAAPPMFVAAPPSTSYFDLLKAVVSDQKLSGEDKKLLLLQLKGISPTSDRFTYRTAIWILGLIAVVAIFAIWHIATGKIDVPQGLIAIASGAVGGLAGLLSPSRASDPHSP
jgi:hypothetical protein